MKVFDNTLARLERALDVRLIRQNVLAANVANVDTPGFRPKDVDFTAAMSAIEGAARNDDGVAQPTPPTLGAPESDQAGISAKDLPIIHGGKRPSIQRQRTRGRQEVGHPALCGFRRKRMMRER
jgi:hypothetical protein